MRPKRDQTEKNLKHRYGITLAEYGRMFEEQAGLCQICENPPKVNSLVVDHCHATGRVRGLLCHLCNMGLGKFQDDPGLLETALGYLRGPGAA